MTGTDASEHQGWHAADGPVTASLVLVTLVILGWISVAAASTGFVAAAVFAWATMVVWGAFCTQGFRATRERLSGWLA